MPDRLSWEGAMPTEHVRWGCTLSRSFALASEVHSLCLQRLSSLSAVPQPVIVVSFLIPEPFYRTSLYNVQLRLSRRLHTSVKQNLGLSVGLEGCQWLLGTSFPQVPSEIFKLKIESR